MEDTLVTRILESLGEALYTHAKEANAAEEAAEAVNYFEATIFSKEQM